MVAQSSPIDGKTVLITGGAGSFGTEFIAYALSECSPRRLIVYSRDEWKHEKCRNRFKQAADAGKLDFFVGDVRDSERLRIAMRAGIDVIIHAAALKRVDVLEYNIFECFATNQEGSKKVFLAAIEAKVPRVVALSTDKASSPFNTYGISKAGMERMAIQANSYAGSGPTRISCTRYGNVAGSRGSVIPVFRHQAANYGTITITDPNMTRFWMLLEESVQLVLRALELMRGGEIFIPELPAYRLADLAKAIAPGAEHRIIGSRPGEKDHELLISADEAKYSRKYAELFILYPFTVTWDSSYELRGEPGEELRSDRARMMGVEELRKELREV